MRHLDSIMQICALVMIQGARLRSVSNALHRTSSLSQFRLIAYDERC